VAISLNSPAWFALRRELELSTKRLLEERGLTGWTVVFESSISRGGRCHHDSKTIGYAVPFMLYASDEQRRNTMLHEVAHAVTGPGHGHDAAWKRLFLRLGGNGSALSEYPKEVFTHENFVWLSSCPTCKDVTGMKQAPQTVWGCAKCPKTVPVKQRILSWSKVTGPVAPEAVSNRYATEHAKLLEELS
jgi:hypothetical protein